MTLDADIIKLAKALIAIPSVTGDTEQAVKILELAKKNLTGYNYKPFVSNHVPSFLFSNQGKNTKHFKIILNAHLDVVPAAKKQFRSVVKNGRLYGRGAYDMKSAAAIMILLFKELGPNLPYPLGLQLVTDEETTGNDGTGFQVDQGVRADFALIGECNSNFRVTNQAKGRLLIKITVAGKAAHSAYAWRGKNAVWDMYEALQPLMDAFPLPKDEATTTTVNITTIKSTNKTTNKIPDDCTAYLDVRYVEKDTKALIANIRSLLPKTVTIDINPKNPFHYVNPSNPFITTLRQQVKSVRGEDLPLRLAHGTSDATFLSAAGCDAIEFGPVGAGAHQEDEWVDIKSLKDYYLILKNFLLAADKVV